MKTENMQIEKEKKEYEAVEVPEELGVRIEQMIANDRKARGFEEPRHRRENRRVLFMMKRTAAAAAACVIFLGVGVNTNEAFAESVSRLPVIGAVAKVLTVREYKEDEGDYNINMKVPGVEVEESGKQVSEDFAGQVNREITQIVDAYTAQAREEFAEYKKAFFETGGTEEEWNNRQMDIIVNYDIKYQQAPYLSFELVTAKGWVAASEERHYYNLDVSRNRELTLADVLGENYKEICYAAVDAQIKEQVAADPGLSYFGYGGDELTEEKFSGVDENTGFYINAKGQVVLVFPEYSIAPGYMGFREFAVGKANL